MEAAFDILEPLAWLLWALSTSPPEHWQVTL